jgi:hypothetical protein
MFLKGFALALTAATAVSSVLTYARWTLTLSSTGKWLRDSFPGQFHLQHIAEIVGFPLVVWLFGAFVFIVPVLLAYLLAQHFRVTSILYYLGGAAVCAAAVAFAFVDDPKFQQFPIPPREQYLSALIQLLPSCFVGAFVFWWLAGRHGPRST